MSKPGDFRRAASAALRRREFHRIRLVAGPARSGSRATTSSPIPGLPPGVSQSRNVIEPGNPLVGPGRSLHCQGCLWLNCGFIEWSQGDSNPEPPCLQTRRKDGGLARPGVARAVDWLLTTQQLGPLQHYVAVYEASRGRGTTDPTCEETIRRRPC